MDLGEEFPFQENCYCQFLEKFTVAEAGLPVLVHISADSQYALWVNGQFVDFGQYADYPEYKVFDEIAITAFVTEGTNELLILAYYQGTDTSTYRRGTAGVIFDVTSGGQTLGGQRSADALPSCLRIPERSDGACQRSAGVFL